jgi:hypothetical protein
MAIENRVLANLRRNQAFDANLRGISQIDKIAEEMADAILYQTNGDKRRENISNLVGKLAGLSKSDILPQAEKVGRANASEILADTPAPINLNDPAERAGALLRGRLKIDQRLQIIRTALDSHGATLDAGLAKYWLEPSEGSAKDKLERLRKIHETLEKRRKDYEQALGDFNAGRSEKRPSKPSLDFMSEMVSQSKQSIRQQARRAGTDAELAVFQAKGHGKFIWITPNGASACPDCRNRQSVVLTLEQWETMGRPGSGKTICDVNCYCMLLPVESVQAAPGMLTGKHSTEAGPMTSDVELSQLNANRVATKDEAAQEAVKTDPFKRITEPGPAPGLAPTKNIQINGTAIEVAGERIIPVNVGGKEINMTPDRHFNGRSYSIVLVDVAKFEKQYQLDAGFYVGKGGAGGIGGRYENFGKFLQKGTPIEMPQAAIGANGIPSFVNGRHRWAYLRDAGATHLPVQVARGDVKHFVSQYDATPIKFVEKLSANPKLPADPAQLLEPKRKKTAQDWAKSLSKLQKETFEEYTGGVYTQIRNAQKGSGYGADNPRILRRVARMEKAIQTAPKWEGVAYRGLSNIPPEQIGNFAHGAELQLDAFSSFSTEQSVAKGFVNLNFEETENRAVFIKARMKNGVDIRPINPMESEILGTKGMRFRVTKVEPFEWDRTISTVYGESKKTIKGITVEMEEI